MTVDIEKLEALAKAAPAGPWYGPDELAHKGTVFDCDLGSLLSYESIESERDACVAYVAAANPAAVLELIADNDRLRESHEQICTNYNQISYASEERGKQLDHLKTEIEGLKTGYEAYERVNAELRAECEKLRNNQSFSDAFYEVSGLLGVTGARPEAPLVVFRQEIVPALQAVIRNSRRYEWLRDSADSADWEFLGYQGKESTDQNIDAAMSKEQSHDN